MSTRYVEVDHNLSRKLIDTYGAHAVGSPLGLPGP